MLAEEHAFAEARINLGNLWRDMIKACAEKHSQAAINALFALRPEDVGVSADLFYFIRNEGGAVMLGLLAAALEKFFAGDAFWESQVILNLVLPQREGVPCVD